MDDGGDVVGLEPTDEFDEPEEAPGPDRVGGPDELPGGPAVLLGEPDELPGGPAVLLDEPDELLDGPAALLDEPDELLGGPAALPVPELMVVVGCRRAVRLPLTAPDSLRMEPVRSVVVPVKKWVPSGVVRVTTRSGVMVRPQRPSCTRW